MAIAAENIDEAKAKKRVRAAEARLTQASSEEGSGHPVRRL